MAEYEDDCEKLAFIQRLKAAVHFTVGKICDEQAQQMDVTFARQFIAVVAEAAFKYCQTMAADLELFAKHARRTTINTDDIILLVRKSPELCAHIKEMADELKVENEQKKKTKRNKRKTATNDAHVNEDSNSSV